MYIVSFSGGKDSTALLLWALNHYPRNEIIPVFADTGAEFHETYEYIKYVESELSLKINVVKNERWDWFEYCRKWGKLPDQKFRRCTSELKTQPLAKWLTKNCNRKVDILLTGERREESLRRKSYQPEYLNKKLRIKGIRPLLTWSTKEVIDYVLGHGIKLNPVYQYFTRLGCFCCVFNTVSEWLSLYRHYPALFEKIAALEEEIGYTIKKGMTLRQAIVKWRSRYDVA